MSSISQNLSTIFKKPPPQLVTSSKQQQEEQTTASSSSDQVASKILLVIDYTEDWPVIFFQHEKSKALMKSKQLIVKQAEWKAIHVEASSTTGCLVRIDGKDEPPFKPDLLMIRNFPRALHHIDYRDALLAFQFGGVDSINSVWATLQCADRPLLYAELNKRSIPLIPMCFYPNQPSSGTHVLLKTTSFPAVVKQFSTHAGFGKRIVRSQSDLDDYRSIVKLGTQYFSIEPFLDIKYEFRIQKIGKHYRAFGRNSSNWKNNWGDIKFEDYPMKDEYIQWADSCADIFGGLDMFALDVAVTTDGNQIILELNDGSFGLMYEHTKEDTGYMVELCLDRLFPSS